MNATHGIVCAAQPEAAEAGAMALKNGGNAIDAAVACALAQGVVDPLMTGAAKAFAAQIDAGEKAVLQRMDLTESMDTSHVSTLDEHGNAVTMTHTLGAPSGVIAPGTGFILNGCMSIFDPRPGKAMSIAPGKSYTSSMSPTILFDDSGPHIVIGAPGAAYLPQAVTQAMGYGLIRNYLSYAFAGVHGVRSTDDGWQGGADPGRDGVALIV